MTEADLKEANSTWEMIEDLTLAISETEGIIEEGSNLLANPREVAKLFAEDRKRYNQEVLVTLKKLLAEKREYFKIL